MKKRETSLSMDLLIDSNIAIDVCANRLPYAHSSAAALDLAKTYGAKLWLYTGSVQMLEYKLLQEFQRNNIMFYIENGLLEHDNF